MSPEDLRARAAGLAGRIGVPLPRVVVGDTPGGIITVSLVRREGSWVLVVDPRVPRLPLPVVDGYLAHPLVGASLGQHVRLQRLLRAITACMVAVELWLVVTGLPLWLVLLVTLPPGGLVLLAVNLLMIRRNVLAADRRVAVLFGPAFLVPALESLLANPPEVKGLPRLLLRALPTPTERLVRLGREPTTPADPDRSRPG